jgi:hypothetical protein
MVAGARSGGSSGNVGAAAIMAPQSAICSQPSGRGSMAPGIIIAE